MRAMVMAAGVGSRLRPLTVNVPKPMVPILNKPAMEHIITLLRRHGINEIVANLWYLPEYIEGYFGDGSDFGIKLSYSRERELRGTAGGVLAAKDLLMPDDEEDTSGQGSGSERSSSWQGYADLRRLDKAYRVPQVAKCPRYRRAETGRRCVRVWDSCYRRRWKDPEVSGKAQAQ